MRRADGRAPDELRELTFRRDFIPSAPGSVLVEQGSTRIVVTATVEDRVPPFLVNTGKGWVSAEYGMLPGSTDRRRPRDGRRGPVDGRTVEIQRLIGRTMRNVIDTDRLGPRTIWIDCDVLQADGGTRTASITASWIALVDCVRRLRDRGLLKGDPMRGGVAAVSVGVVDGAPLLDLSYEEDSRAQADFNFIMAHDGRVIEVQGGTESRPIERATFEACWELAETGVARLAAMQEAVLAGGETT